VVFWAKERHCQLFLGKLEIVNGFVQGVYHKLELSKLPSSGGLFDMRNRCVGEQFAE
jgi:hypothetical protein